MLSDEQEAMDPPTTPPTITLQVAQSTPIKGGIATIEPFTTTHKFRIESCAALADEMSKYLVGPMPARQFLDDFLPTEEIPDYHVSMFDPGCYDSTVNAENERLAYDPFVSVPLTLLT